MASNDMHVYKEEAVVAATTVLHAYIEGQRERNASITSTINNLKEYVGGDTSDGLIDALDKVGSTMANIEAKMTKLEDVFNKVASIMNVDLSNAKVKFGDALAAMEKNALRVKQAANK